MQFDYGLMYITLQKSNFYRTELNKLAKIIPYVEFEYVFQSIIVAMRGHFGCLHTYLECW